MNLGGYSSRPDYGWGILLLTYFIVVPYVLLWLEVRVFRHSAAQSNGALLLLVVLSLPACYYARSIFADLSHQHGLFAFQYWVIALSLIGLPLAVAWEAYKQGWWHQVWKHLRKKNKKKRKLKT